MKRIIQQSKLDFVKYWPIIASLIAFISGYATLKADVSAEKKENEKQHKWLVSQSQRISSLKEGQTENKLKIDNLQEKVRELKSRNR